MAEEKSKLKSMQTAIRQKQGDLSQALQYTKVEDMENRIKELQKTEPQVDRQLQMLERIKSKQLHHLEVESIREEKSMEQVNVYKAQFADLNKQRRDNDK